MEFSANITFICEYDGLYCYWLQFGNTGKMIQLREEDVRELEDDP